MCAKTYIEPQTTIPVYDECDVLVVGGGAAGHSAAVAAARAGCKNVILMERYGYCGGDVTGVTSCSSPASHSTKKHTSADCRKNGTPDFPRSPEQSLDLQWSLQARQIPL